MPDYPLHRALRQAHCNLNDIKFLLEQDASLVNKLNPDGDRPLHLLLRNPECSVDIVQLLLYYGADSNLEDKRWHRSPLNYALQYSADAKVIELLLENGADPNNISCGETALHTALHFMQRQVTYPKPNPILQKVIEYILDVLKLLLQKFTDVNKSDLRGRTPMCLALQSHQSDVIKFLLDAGGDLSGCECHVSPLHCYIDHCFLLNIEVMKEFLDVGADINKVDREGNTPLHLALRNAYCGVKDIKYLLDQKDVDIDARNRKGRSFLHCAVTNNLCKVSILKLLIQRGACVDAADTVGSNPLHFAAVITEYRPDFIKILLDNGCTANVVDISGLSPLYIAVTKCISEDECSKIKGPVRKNYVKVCKQRLERVKLILKYVLLQCPDFNIEKWIKKYVRHYYLEVSGYARECLIELQGMELEHVGSNFTLRQFLEVSKDKSAFKLKAKECDFNKLLNILIRDTFPVYCEVILAQVERSYMIDKLQEIVIYTQMSSSEFPCRKKKVILNYPSVRHVADFLSKHALLNLMQSFCNSENHTSCGHCNENDLGKRSRIQCKKCVKRLCHICFFNVQNISL